MEDLLSKPCARSFQDGSRAENSHWRLVFREDLNIKIVKCKIFYAVSFGKRTHFQSLPCINATQKRMPLQYF